MLKPVTASELTKVIRNMKEKLDSRKKETKENKNLLHKLLRIIIKMQTYQVKGTGNSCELYKRRTGSFRN